MKRHSYYPKTLLMSSSLLQGKYQQLYQSLIQIADPSRIYTDPMNTLAWGTDASFYRLVPKIVIKAHSEEEISRILQNTHAFNIPVTFRAAGTSLSGQAVTDSVLIVASDQWKQFQILENGNKIKLQPGITGGKVNSLLAPYGRKIGPDPASINAAMVGGMAANNASGMCCGTADNSYQTVESMRIILYDGTLLDTGDDKSKKEFAASHPEILKQITQLGDEVRANKSLSEKIKHKFKIKNTNGYSLNAFTDYTDPFDIINHVMIGSEGTLGFIAEITYRTIAEHPGKATSLLLFHNIEDACKAATILKNQPVAAVELIDRAGLRSVENNKGMPAYLKDLDEDISALLVETRGENHNQTEHQIQIIKNSIRDISTARPIEFTNKPAEYNQLWNIRKGLFPSVGAMRATGTTVIIEDVAFPIQHLAQGTLDLQQILKKYEYHEAVLFGHAMDGNLHFVFNQDFGTQKEISRYARFMDELAEMVVKKYNGSLKAEHGTGRNMAPYVEMEWGRDAYVLMHKIKNIFDPDKLINPGVILNPSPTIHLENLKPLAPVDPVIDKCIECGFCENICVSTDLTLSPRQRIVVLREMERLKKGGHEQHILASLVKSFDYQGDKTCATDGLCALNCPVKIDTGEMIKAIRQREMKPLPQKIARIMANNMSGVIKSTSLMLDATALIHSVVGTKTMKAMAGGLRKMSGNRIPQWNKAMPRGGKRIPKHETPTDNPLKVVYFPSCINRAMGVSKEDSEKTPLSHKLPQLLEKAGYGIIYPANMKNLCCGMAYSSKGFRQTGKEKSDELEKALLQASEHGKYPVLCDMSPCLYTMKTNMEPTLKLYEPIEFILEHLSDKLEFRPVDEKVSVFTVCSAKKMGLEDDMIRLAKKCTTQVVNIEANCCGFAGDKGFTTPELNAHGLRSLKEQTKDSVAGYSTSRTCENGLSLHSEKSFQSIIYLVDKVTKKRQTERRSETTTV